MNKQKAANSEWRMANGGQVKDVPYSGGLQSTATYVAGTNKIPGNEKSVPNCSDGEDSE